MSWPNDIHGAFHLHTEDDVYRWLLAEARWLAGPVAIAQHRIRLRENAFERIRDEAAALGREADPPREA